MRSPHLAAVEKYLVLFEAGRRAEHFAADSTDRPSLVHRPVFSQIVDAIERLVADRTDQAWRATCRKQQQRVRIVTCRENVSCVSQQHTLRLFDSKDCHLTGHVSKAARTLRMLKAVRGLTCSLMLIFSHAGLRL